MKKTLKNSFEMSIAEIDNKIFLDLSVSFMRSRRDLLNSGMPFCTLLRQLFEYKQEQMKKQLILHTGEFFEC